MYTLEKLVINPIEVEDMDGKIEMFMDEQWVRVVSMETKISIREHISREGLGSERLRMIHPGGMISNPMNIKLQGESKVIKKQKQVNKYRVAPDHEPLIIPKQPLGRMRFVLRNQ